MLHYPYPIAGTLAKDFHMAASVQGAMVLYMYVTSNREIIAWSGMPADLYAPIEFSRRLLLYLSVEIKE